MSLQKWKYLQTHTRRVRSAQRENEVTSIYPPKAALTPCECRISSHELIQVEKYTISLQILMLIVWGYCDARFSSRCVDQSTVTSIYRDNCGTLIEPWEWYTFLYLCYLIYETPARWWFVYFDNFCETPSGGNLFIVISIKRGPCNGLAFDIFRFIMLLMMP